MKISKTFTYKLLTNKEEYMRLQSILNSTTFCHNLYLHYNQLSFKKTKKKIDLFKMFNQLPAFQVKYKELAQVHISYLNSSIVNLFYSLKSIQSIEMFPDFLKNNRRIVLLRDFKIDELNSKILIPHFNALSYINSRKIIGNVKAIHLIHKFDEWYLDVIVEQDVRKVNQPKETKFLGIDVGLNDFAVLSNGMKINNPRFYRKMEEKLKKEQKSLSRKNKDSKNYQKQLRKVRNVHKRIFNARMDFLHQLSSYLIEEYDVIGVEKLAISEMKRDRRFAKSVQDASWGTFIKLLKYKAKEKGKTIVEVNRYYPSTKTCSNCGNTEFMPIHLRTFQCTKCQLKIHRDYNAALNIEQKAIHHAFVHNPLGNGG